MISTGRDCGLAEWINKWQHRTSTEKKRASAFGLLEMRLSSTFLSTSNWKNTSLPNLKWLIAPAYGGIADH